MAGTPERSLLLISRRFPFKKDDIAAAESYLESEIGYLAESFDLVIAAGVEASEDDALVCQLPSNVVPVALGCVNTIPAKAVLLLQGLFDAVAGKPYVKKLLESEESLSPSHFVYACYFAAKSKRAYDSVQKIISDRELSPTHIYSFWLFDTALVASWVADDSPRTVAFSRAHRYDLYEEFGHSGWLPARRYLLSHLDAVLPCSSDGTKYLASRYPESVCKIETAYLGTRDLPDKSAEPAESRFQLLSCSRVVDVKRVELILDAVLLLDSEGVEIDWVHFGDGENLAKIRKRASKLRVATATFPGNLPYSTLLKEYEDSHYDLFVNVSTSEGLPLSIMEACGCGIPVIATDVGGTHEIVKEGENGFLLPSDLTPEMLAMQIRKVMEFTPWQRLALRRSSRAIWERDFRTKTNVKAMLTKFHAGEDTA